MRWQLQEVKAQLSDLVKKAILDGPQDITVHGKTAVIVISKEKHDQLTQSTLSFVEFMKQSPLAKSTLRIKCNKTPCRDIKL